MGRLIRYIVRCTGHETTSPPAGGSWNPAPNEMRMKDVLFHNFFWYKGHKTASALYPTETFWGTCTSAAIRQTASPRGILHLICIGKRKSCTKQHPWHDFAREVRPKQTTFVVRVCEGVFMPKGNVGRKTTEAALKSLALKKL